MVEARLCWDSAAVSLQTHRLTPRGPGLSHLPSVRGLFLGDALSGVGVGDGGLSGSSGSWGAGTGKVV